MNSRIIRDKLFPFVLFNLMVPPTYCEEIDWLGDEMKGGQFGVRVGHYKDGGYSNLFNITLPSFYYSEFHGFYSHFESDDIASDQWAIRWNSDPLFKWQLSFALEHTGEGGSVSTQEAFTAVQYTFTNGWQSLSGHSDTNRISKTVTPHNFMAVWNGLSLDSTTQIYF